MNHRPNQPNPSESGKTSKPSLPTGVEQSDSKEILFLAAGLITLTLGLGGLFMYSADETLPVTASQEAADEVGTFQMAEAFATPSSSPITSVPSSHLATEPSLHLVSNVPETSESNNTNVYFEFDRWGLSDGAKSMLKTQVTAQGEDWTGTLHIDGYTDAQGTDSYNRTLGLKRAKAVKTYLLSLGIPENRIQVKSFGKDGAVCEEETPDCFEHNRRAHVAFLSQPVVQQDDSLLSLNAENAEATEDTTSESSSSMTDSPSIDEYEVEIALQEEMPGELVAIEPVASAGSLP